MKLIEEKLKKEEIDELKRKYGSYLKLTVDLKKEVMVAGCQLHTDGERILLERGSRSSDIWGGGIDLENKLIDFSAVLNLRPNVGNDSMEILDEKKRKKFSEIVRRLLAALW